jgi:hypothetical protein
VFRASGTRTVDRLLNLGAYSLDWIERLINLLRNPSNVSTAQARAGIVVLKVVVLPLP